MALAEQFALIMRKLPFSEERIPYTYHHDYLRQNVAMFKGYSRGEIAALKCWSEDELYATALIELLNETKTITAIFALNSDTIFYVLIAHNILQRYLERLTDVPKIEYSKLIQLRDDAVKELTKMQEYHTSSSRGYGSKLLCAGDMLRQEEAIENRIKTIQTQLDRYQLENTEII